MIEHVRGHQVGTTPTEVGNTDPLETIREGSVMRTEKRYPDELFVHLAEDYQRLGSRRRVAELYGCSESLIQKKLCQMGIPRREKTEAMIQKNRTPEGREAARKRLLALYERRPSARPTTLELLFARACEMRGVSFKAQVPIGDYIVDFLIGERVIVEVDGWQHRLFAEQRERDRVRDEWFVSHGYVVFRFTGQQLHRDAIACVDFVLQNANVLPNRMFTAEWLTSKGRKRGKPVSEETRKKMSEAKRQHWQDPVKRAAMVEGIKRGQRTPEFREKVHAQRSAFMKKMWADQAERERRIRNIRLAKRRNHGS